MSHSNSARLFILISANLYLIGPLIAYVQANKRVAMQIFLVFIFEVCELFIIYFTEVINLYLEMLLNLAPK
jgi:hypothetical protein